MINNIIGFSLYYIMEQSIKEYCYDYWVSGNIVDASTYKIYQNDKLVYDSSVDSKKVYINIEIEGGGDLISPTNQTKPTDSNDLVLDKNQSEYQINKLN